MKHHLLEELDASEPAERSCPTAKCFSYTTTYLESGAPVKFQHVRQRQATALDAHAHPAGVGTVCYLAMDLRFDAALIPKNFFIF
jgi:hypothetical protein